MSRRSFLHSGSLALGVAILADKLLLLNLSPAHAAPPGTFRPHAFVEISPDDRVTVWVGQSNLGQGTHTGIAMIVADELDADWRTIQTKMALAAKPFKDPIFHAQLTGGSTSIRHRWEILRTVGAAARLMLITAAAGQWGIDAKECSTSEGRVLHPDGRTLRYGQLVAAAAELPVPDNPPLKEEARHHIIGTKRQRLDIPDKVEGRAVFGIDMQLPDMCIAVVARPPRFGARPKHFDKAAAMAVNGVLRVVELTDRIAVCARSTHAALQGRGKLSINWTEGADPQLDDAKLAGLFTEHLQKPGAVALQRGDVEKALKQAPVSREATYFFPYVAHAALEPINCTAHVQADRCRVWVPTQGQTVAQNTAARLTGLPLDKVEVMTTLCGGGFGLRGEPDPVIDAVQLSQIMQRPVKVMWTREDDFAHDYFRPGSASSLRAALSDKGEVVAWFHRVASQSIMSRSMPQHVKNGIDPSSLHGVTDMVYSFPNQLAEYVMMDLPIPVGFWRSVGYPMNLYAIETFIDELAHAAGQDPILFRLRHMEKESRPYRTLTLLAEKTDWGGTVAAGRFRGVAVGSCFGSSAAHMAELSVERASGTVTVHRLVCALDCGPAVYPDAIRAQLEGAAIMGLGLAFHEQIRFAAGGVQSTNFDSYRVPRMSEVPEIEVHIAKSRHPIGGVGEPGVPTVAPAVANALFQATGVRPRRQPFQLGALRQGV